MGWAGIGRYQDKCMTSCVCIQPSSVPRRGLGSKDNRKPCSKVGSAGTCRFASPASARSAVSSRHGCTVPHLPACLFCRQVSSPSTPATPGAAAPASPAAMKARRSSRNRKQRGRARVGGDRDGVNPICGRGLVTSRLLLDLTSASLCLRPLIPAPSVRSVS